MDRLRQAPFLHHFGGKVFISQYEALKALDPAFIASVHTATGERTAGIAQRGVNDAHSS